MQLTKVALLATAFALVVCAPSFADVCGLGNQLYCQEFDHTGNAYSSQNDTNGFGLFAQVYDNFSLSGSGQFVLDTIRFEGEYFNPPQQGPITGWTVNLYADSAGQPGGLMFTQSIAGTGNETFDGNFGGFPAYVYTLTLPDWLVNSNTTYWVSVYPDLGFPPQWGWSSGTGGDGISYQDFFGARSQLSADMAWVMGGHPQRLDTPEPGTLVMLATGVLGLTGAIRRKLI